MNTSALPVTRNLSPSYALSVIVAALMALTSLAGVFFQSAIYPTDKLRQTLVPNDAVNLLIGLPILLGSLWLARRGKMIGLLLLPGALFYLLYTYVVYVFATSFHAMFFLYLALAVLSAYAMIQVVASIDAKTARQRLEGAVPEKIGAGVLIGFGILFFLRAIGVILNSPTAAVLAVAVADLIITPVWIIGGVMLWRRNSLGYVIGLGLLFQASMLFIALIVFLLLQPFLTTAPFALADTVVIFIMGLVCFIPFALFVRGAVSKETQGEH